MKIGFGMNVTVLPACVRRVLDHVLVLHDVVGRRQQRVVAHVDLGLARRADLVVVHLDRDADLLQVQHHLGAQVLVVVHRRQREVALLVPRLVPEVVARPPRRRSSRCPPPSRCGSSPRAGSGRTGSSRRCRTRLRSPVASRRRCPSASGTARPSSRCRGGRASTLAGHRVLHEAVDVQRRVLRGTGRCTPCPGRGPGACRTPGSPGTRGSSEPSNAEPVLEAAPR